MRIFLFIVMVSFSLVSFQSTARANGLLYFFFPMLKPVQPRASKTLEAPFADKEALRDKKLASGLPENSIPLALPHRNDLQISEWLTAHVSESLSIRAGFVDKDLKNAQVYFDPQGWKDFQAYLRDTKMSEIMQRRQYDIQSFVDTSPLLLNKGAANGSYKWLYEVSVLVSYLPKGLKDYTRTKHEPVTQNIVLNIQVGRKANVAAEHSVQIETWSGRVVKSSRKEL